MSDSAEPLKNAADEHDMDRLTEIAAAYFSNNATPPERISFVIAEIHRSLSEIASNARSAEVPPPPQKPVVPIRKSVFPDYIICLEDGKKLKMLKRHLNSAYGMTPEEYRAKWGLAADYPMVAPNYAQARSEMAKKIGLGKKPRGR